MPESALLSISLIILHLKPKMIAHTKRWKEYFFSWAVIIFKSICIIPASWEYKNKPNLYSQESLCFVLCFSKISLWGCSWTSRKKKNLAEKCIVYPPKVKLPPQPRMLSFSVTFRWRQNEWDCCLIGLLSVESFHPKPGNLFYSYAKNHKFFTLSRLLPK